MLTLQQKIVTRFPRFLKKIFFPSWIEVEDFVKTIVDEIPVGAYILDAGAGQCQYKKLFPSQQYFAIDAAVGEEAWDYSQLDMVGDLCNVPVKNNSFHIVLSTQVLEHVKEPQSLILETFRILHPGGSIYLSAPQSEGVHQEPHDYFRFTRYGMQHLFEKAGFSIEYIKPSCGYFRYLANRISIFPKIIFWQIKNPLLRLIFLPLELLSYIICVFLIPAFLNIMDGLDRKRDWAINYFVKATKPADSKE